VKNMANNIREYWPFDYWRERLCKNFSLGGVGMLGLGRVLNSWLYRTRKLAVNRALSRMRIKVKGQSVLDVGCGTGFWLEYWRRKGATHIAGN
jgi:2-polyprenyl-3-methyl-5-hydroxy-6-metoxy-1,4-benzoquinol methylase